MLIRCMHSIRRNVILTTRNLRLSPVVLGGGAHDHHGSIPIYKPKPGPSERNFFGEGKAPRISEDHPYTPGFDDFVSYFGAAVGVLLCFLAVAYKTDVFSKDKGGHGHHDSGKKSHKTMSASHTEEESHKSAGELTEEDSQPTEEPSEGVRHEPAAPLEPSYTVTSESNAEQESLETSKTRKQDGTSESKLTESRKEAESVEDRQASQQAPSDTRDVHLQALETNTQAPARPEGPPTLPSADKMPEYVEYLLVGAGTASYYAALSIRARDADAKVLMIGDEKHLPYNRPPLSKELWWYGDDKSVKNLKYKALSGKTRDVFFESQGFYVPPGELSDAKHGGVSIVRGKRVTRLCTTEKKAFLEDGTVIRFNKCLIATGGHPKTIKELSSEAVKDRIVYFRGVDDYRNLESICSTSKSVTIIGGGFLGSELAYGIKRKYPELEVNQVMQEKGNLAKVLPEYLAEKATESLEKQGVNIVTNSRVMEAKKVDEDVEITGAENKKIKSDYILVAAGIEADISIAEASGLETDPKNGGILADSELRVCPGVYCAGDNCSFFDRSLGRRRVEHWEHAQISGRLAGENMTGGEKSFWFQSSFFTKFSPDYHINAVGNTDSSLETVSVFAKDEANEKFERGVIFYKNKDDKVVGLLMVNVFGPSIDVGRRLIEDGRPIQDYRELAKLFPLFEQPKEDTPTAAEEDVADKH